MSHDIELTRILNKIYTNYNFREQIRDNDIIFDYKIYDGASISSNAIKKLQDYIRFPKEIITEGVDFNQRLVMPSYCVSSFRMILESKDYRMIYILEIENEKYLKLVDYIV